MYIWLRSGHGVLCIADVTQSSKEVWESSGGTGIDCVNILTEYCCVDFYCQTKLLTGKCSTEARRGCRVSVDGTWKEKPHSDCHNCITTNFSVSPMLIKLSFAVSLHVWTFSSISVVFQIFELPEGKSSLVHSVYYHQVKWEKLATRKNCWSVLCAHYLEIYFKFHFSWKKTKQK